MGEGPTIYNRSHPFHYDDEKRRKRRRRERNAARFIAALLTLAGHRG